jgi:hypothetical protein
MTLPSECLGKPGNRFEKQHNSFGEDSTVVNDHSDDHSLDRPDP